MSNERFNGWAYLPDNLLEEIFFLLPIKNISRCSQVCSNWNRIAKSKYVWQKFKFKDYAFTRRKFTSHYGWQHVIDHWRLRLLILNAAEKWRKLEVEPVTILFNLYEFFRVLINFAEYYEKNTTYRPLTTIRSFSFKWQLHIHQRGEDQREQMFGTGGEMLKALSLLLSYLHGLTDLTLRELQLESYECNNFIDDILFKFNQQLTSLCIVNITKAARAFLQFGLFLNLKRLVISAQHLDESIVILLADLYNLQVLVLYQVWHFNFIRYLILQPKAPVYAIIHEKSTGQLTSETAQFNYSETLQYYIQEGLERHYRSRRFVDRVDLFLIQMAICSNLKLLVMRERVNYMTAILLALTARQNNTNICLRRNALLKRVFFFLKIIFNVKYFIIPVILLTRSLFENLILVSLLL
ncbi:unnamed protein product [Dracunculus medinensis]|uniref:F-box domain-containing protein n=1 Tax=Dracunculus medinensis TaxID=318479 RepID=A0A0N4UGB4_DRAME|nr:unnamed protein product [Dracunculus medinensis]